MNSPGDAGPAGPPRRPRPPLRRLVGPGTLLIALVVLLVLRNAGGQSTPRAATGTPRATPAAARSSPARAFATPPRGPATPKPPIRAPFQPAGAAAQPTAVATRPPDDLLRLVSKTSDPLPQDYVPPDLEPLPPSVSDQGGLQMRHDAAQAFVLMAAAARQQGLTIVAVSTYRTFAEQARVYDDEVTTFGKAQADRESAFPGRSEHQLGTAADISSPRDGYGLDDNFDRTPEGAWLLQHAVEFGFVLSYPEGKEDITGYRFEPWHFRYVGVPAAKYIVASGLTSTEVLSAHQAAGDDAFAAQPPAP